jgi:hypothetical protein
VPLFYLTALTLKGFRPFLHDVCTTIGADPSVSFYLNASAADQDMQDVQSVSKMLITYHQAYFQSITSLRQPRI